MSNHGTITARRPGPAIRGFHRVPRALHPLAWWIWAGGLVIAVSRTTNPVLLLLTLAVLALVVANRRTDAPWARGFKYYLMVAGFIIFVQVVLQSVFTSGIQPGDHVLFRLPQIPTPKWYAGVELGGRVSLEATLAAVCNGLRLGTMICCVGAANALANPKRALRVLPGALYELGMAVVVTVTLAPQLIESVQRVARARRLRAGQRRGLRALGSIAIPVLADALERSLLLAAAMDSRGYGRTGTATRASRRVTGALMVAGMVGICAGCYGLLGGSGPRFLGTPAIATGAVLCGAGLVVGGRRVRRTQYRPDPWRLPEWIVAGCGLVSAVALYLSTGYNAADLAPSFRPLAFPPLPAVPAVAILLAGAAAFVAPPPPRTRRASRPARDAQEPASGRVARPEVPA
jgi:energy-coupling factor transport system permease protein